MDPETLTARLLVAVAVLALAASCGTGIRSRAATDVGEGDAGIGDVRSGDAGSGDAQGRDARGGDVGSGDVGSGDTGSGDAEGGDAGSGDVGSGDVGSGDAGSGDVAGGDAGGEEAGSGETFVSQTVDGRLGGVLQLQEATLEVCKGCVAGEATIVLRRYETISHKGAQSPVFEIELPSPDTFINDPKISIATTSPPPKAVIGFLISNADIEQWIPDSPAIPPVCDAGTVCGPVQIGSFTNPQSNPAYATTTVKFAILQQCDATPECGSQQACSSRACQECQAGSECNP